jgi:asparagine synthetase B (glutamine-hydrolysing)
MCGIAGLLRLDADEPDWSVVQAMTDAVAHRGPDDRDVWRNSRVALGHRRLSIIDLTPAGRQPMPNEDGSIRITYNGEVYNYAELKAAFVPEASLRHFAEVFDRSKARDTLSRLMEVDTTVFLPDDLMVKNDRMRWPTRWRHACR